MSEKVKSMSMAICPHCHENILVEMENTLPMVKNVIKEDDIRRAKDEVIRAVKAIKAPLMEKEPIITWINNDETVFGPEEVDSIIKDIKSKLNGDNQDSQD